MQTASIIAGCPAAPNFPVAGMPRRERLLKDLEKRNFQLIPDPARADLKIPDCRVFVGDQLMHLCADGLSRIEDRLLNSLRKPVDGLVSRLINRRISLFITRRLMNTYIKPNQISLVTLLIGIASGVVLAQGSYWTVLLGTLLLQTQSVLDGVDGELARLKFQGSHFGQWLDTLSDDLANFSFLIGATVAVSLPTLRWFGVLGIAAFAITKGILYHALITVYHSGDLLAFQWNVDKTDPSSFGSKLRFLFKHDFFCLFSVFLALLGGINLILIITVAGHWVVFVTLLRQRFNGRPL